MSRPRGNGICPRCGKAPKVPEGYGYCVPCRKLKNSEIHKARRAAAKAAKDVPEVTPQQEADEVEFIMEMNKITAKYGPPPDDFMRSEP